MYEKPKAWKDWAILLTAWATAIAVFLKAAFDWEIEQFIGPAVTIIMLTAFLLWNLYGIFKNNNVTKEAKAKEIVAESQPEEVERIKRHL